MTNIDLSGTTAIITGGGRGLGRSMVFALAGAGANVTLEMPCVWPRLSWTSAMAASFSSFSREPRALLWAAHGR